MLRLALAILLATVIPAAARQCKSVPFPDSTTGFLAAFTEFMQRVGAGVWIKVGDWYEAEGTEIKIQTKESQGHIEIIRLRDESKNDYQYEPELVRTRYAIEAIASYFLGHHPQKLTGMLERFIPPAPFEAPSTRIQKAHTFFAGDIKVSIGGKGRLVSATLLNNTCH